MLKRVFLFSVLVAGLGGAVVQPTAQSAVPGRQAASSIDRDQLLRDLQVLSADDMQGRQVGTPGGEKARAYVIERFKASGISPIGGSFERPFTFMTGRGGAQTERRGVNVVGQIVGSQFPGRYIVVSAHYDHLGVRGGTEVFNGADDNASGTAALFALARQLSTRRPLNTVIFAALDAEEVGLRGARDFVKTPPVSAEAIVLNLNMDMIGRDPNDLLYVVGTYLQPFLAPHITAVAAKAPVKLVMGHDDPTKTGVEDWTRQSDHWAFIEAKIPALYFGVEDFAQHHKSTDDYETMTHDFYVRAVETMLLVVREFDANLDSVERARPR